MKNTYTIVVQGVTSYHIFTNAIWWNINTTHKEFAVIYLTGKDLQNEDKRTFHLQGIKNIQCDASHDFLEKYQFLPNFQIETY